MSEQDYSMVRGQVLIVDDEPEVLNSLRRTLRRDFDVFTARNAEEGFAVLRNHPIQVIISDQRMPDVSGASFLANIREAYPDAIRMLITGYTDMDALVEAVNQGQIHRYLTKPWDPEAVRQYVIDAYDRYRGIVRNHRLSKNLAERNEQLNDELERYRQGHAGCIAELGLMTERQKVLRDLLNDAIIILDEDGLILDFNSPAERLLARTARNRLSQSFVLALPYPLNERLWHYIKEDSTTALQLDLPLQSGGSMPVEVQARTVAPANDSSPELIVRIRDISAQRDRDLNELLTGHLFDCGDIPRLLVDLAGHIRRANAASTTLLGYTEQDLLGHPLRRLDTSAMPSGNDSPLSLASSIGQWQGEMHLRRKQGGSQTCTVRIDYLNGSSARPGFLVEITADSTN